MVSLAANPTDFFLANPTTTIPTIESLRGKWRWIGDYEIRNTICYEHQYLKFHLWQLKNLRHTKGGCCSDPPYRYELGLSLRAGAIKAAVLLCAAIAEAVLKYHAEERGYLSIGAAKGRVYTLHTLFGFGL
jgi:hypothetical protein